MTLVTEGWEAQFTRGDHGKMEVGLYAVGETGELSFLDAEEFGPFDTATDILQWLVRHLAPRWRLPLR